MNNVKVIMQKHNKKTLNKTKPLTFQPATAAQVSMPT